MANDDDRYLTTAEAAEYVGFAVGTLLNRLSAGTGPQVHRLGKRTLRWKKSDLDAWMAGELLRTPSDG